MSFTEKVAIRLQSSEKDLTLVLDREEVFDAIRVRLMENNSPFGISAPIYFQDIGLYDVALDKAVREKERPSQHLYFVEPEHLKQDILKESLYKKGSLYLFTREDDFSFHYWPPSGPSLDTSARFPYDDFFDCSLT